MCQRSMIVSSGGRLTVLYSDAGGNATRLGYDPSSSPEHIAEPDVSLQRLRESNIDLYRAALLKSFRSRHQTTIMFQATVMLPQPFLEAFIQVRVTECAAIVAFSLVVWDYFVLLPDEVSLIWPAKWSLPKYLFVINRYLAFVDPILLIYFLLFGHDAQVCVTTFRAFSCIVKFGSTVSQWILILRTHAVWGNKRDKSFFGLLTAYLCTIGVDIWSIEKYLSGAYSYGAIAPGMTGCSIDFENRMVWVSFVTMIFVESTVFSLLTCKAVQTFRIGGSSLMDVIYRDGLLYFACNLASSITNLVVVLVAPVGFNSFLIIVQRVLHSVLCSRILLHIRAANQTGTIMGDQHTDQSRVTKSMSFVQRRNWNRQVEVNNSEAITLTTV